MADRKPKTEEPCDSCGMVVQLESHGGTMTADNEWLCTWCAEDRADPRAASFASEAEAFALANCRVTAPIGPYDSEQDTPSAYQSSALSECTNESEVLNQLESDEGPRRRAFAQAVRRRFATMVDFANTGDPLVVDYGVDDVEPDTIETSGTEVLPLLKGGNDA